MTANALHNIAQIETRLFEAADQLRANSNPVATATEFSMPVLGVISLRHAVDSGDQQVKAKRPSGIAP